MSSGTKFVHQIRNIKLLQIKQNTNKHHRSYCLSQSYTSVSYHSANMHCHTPAYTAAGAGSLRVWGAGTNGNKTCRGTSARRLCIAISCSRTSSTISCTTCSWGQPQSQTQSQSSFHSHATVEAAQSGSLSIIKEAHGPAQENSSKYCLRHCVIKHSSALCSNTCHHDNHYISKRTTVVSTTSVEGGTCLRVCCLAAESCERLLKLLDLS